MHNRMRSTVLIGAGLTLAALGCGGKDRVENHLDPPSLMRLSAVAEGGRVVTACRATPLPEKLSLTEVTELDRAGSSVLLELPKAKMQTISGIQGLERTSVWGDAQAIAKLDARLKQDLLAAWDQGQMTPMPLIARFADGTADLEHALTQEGAAPRTVAGPVVTLDADPETILRITTMPGLLSLSRPTTLQPLGGG
jgi:hypothetical protein